MLMKMKMKKGGISIENHCSPSDCESVSDVRLPQDLITEILLHLPVKYLVKFKCVSKPWRTLISSPQFIKSHFSTSLMDGKRFNHQLLFVDRNPNYGMKHSSLSAVLQLHNPSTNVVVSDIEYPCPDHLGPLRIVGIVNGLVCLFVDKNDLYIWNPILKNSKLLPGSTLPLSSSVEYGFGYDESNDDYKVVQVFDVDSGAVYRSKVKVYSLRTDSWKIIEGFMDGVPFRNGAYANGKIMWTAVRTFCSDEKWKIVSLDMANDDIEELQGPCYEFGGYNCGIGSFGGSVSMICSETSGKKVDLWVMDKTGVEESWSRVFSLPWNHDFHPAGRQYFLEKVVCFLGDGEIVLEGRWQLSVYCTKNKELRNIQLNANGGGAVYRDFCVYVESLVPV